MIEDINIKRIIRRHSRFNGVEIDKKGNQLIIDIVRECIKTNELTRKQKDLKFRKLRKTMY